MGTVTKSLNLGDSIGDICVVILNGVGLWECNVNGWCLCVGLYYGLFSKS